MIWLCACVCVCVVCLFWYCSSLVFSEVFRSVIQSQSLILENSQPIVLHIFLLPHSFSLFIQESVYARGGVFDIVSQLLECSGPPHRCTHSFLLIVLQFGEFLLTYIFKCALSGVESPDEPVGTVLFLSSTSI